MNSKNPFKWRHFEKEIILLSVRWYLRYALSYRDLEEMMLERRVKVDHTTTYRWVQSYSPEIEKRCKTHLQPTNDSYRVDETYIKVRANGSTCIGGLILKEIQLISYCARKEIPKLPNGFSGKP